MNMGHRYSVGLSIGLILVGSAGCTSERLSADYRSMRRELVNLHEQQIFENILAAYYGRVIVHLDYEKITGVSQTKLRGEVNGRITESDQSVVNVPGGDSANDTITISDANFIGGSASGEIFGQMSMDAKPVMTSAVYEAYHCFVREAIRQDDAPAEIKRSERPLSGELTARAGDAYFALVVNADESARAEYKKAYQKLLKALLYAESKPKGPETYEINLGSPIPVKIQP